MAATHPDHDREIAAMFDRIAPRYDRLDRLLSFGADASWRRRAIALARLGPSERALDIGAGTGDLSLGLVRASDPTSVVFGVDLAQRMLTVSRRRASGRYFAVLANAEALPVPDACLDRVVSAFTLRNIGDLTRALREMRRVLRPGGRTVLLELSHPPNAAFRSLYLFYFERILPLLAAVLGGEPAAYRYLPRSLEPFPAAERLAELLREAGFTQIRFERLTSGIAAIHVAVAGPS